MKRFFVVLSFLCFMTAIAEVVSTCPSGGQNNPWFSESRDRGEYDADQFQTSAAPEAKNVIDYSTIAPSPGVSQKGPDVGTSDDLLRWGNDVLVMSYGVPTLGKLSTDQDEQNGDIYVSLLIPKSGIDDSLYVYRSQDGGSSWSFFTLITSNATYGSIVDQEILVGSDGVGADSSLIYVFFVYDSASTDGGIWVRRLRPTGHINWIQIIQDGDSIENISVDRNIEDPQHIFLAWSNTDESIDMESSSDYGLTWGNHRNVAGNARNVSVCAGGDGYVYIAYQYQDTTDIEVGRYTNNLITPSINFEIIQSNIYGNFTPSVAAARTTPGSSQVAWVMYRQMNNIGNASIRYSTTTDGGATWASGIPWPPTNVAHATWDMKYPYARVSYNESSVVRVVTTVPESGPDSVVYAFAAGATPTTWSGRGVYNDYGITTEFGPRVDYSSDISGGYLVYRQIGSPNIWIDAWNFTSGIDDGNTDNLTGVNLVPNPTTGTAILSYNIKNAGNVRISLLDVSGRLIENLLNESKAAGGHSLSIDKTNLPSGIYFIKINSPDGVAAAAMTVIK